MKNVFIIFENQLIRVFFLLTLLFYSIFMSYLFFNKNEKIILIGIDNKKTFRIENKDNSLLKYEELNFVRYFTTLLYNYDKSTFENNVGKATEFMTDKYWSNNKKTILDLHEKVKNNGLSQSSFVYKIVQNKDLTYSVFIETQLSFKSKDKIKSKIDKYEIKLSLTKSQRSESNVWALAVNDIKDMKVN